MHLQQTCMCSTELMTNRASGNQKHKKRPKTQQKHIKQCAESVTHVVLMPINSRALLSGSINLFTSLPHSPGSRMLEPPVATDALPRRYMRDAFMLGARSLMLVLCTWNCLDCEALLLCTAAVKALCNAAVLPLFLPLFKVYSLVIVV
jgi:hypothetical protein